MNMKMKNEEREEGEEEGGDDRIKSTNLQQAEDRQPKSDNDDCTRCYPTDAKPQREGASTTSIC